MSMKYPFQNLLIVIASTSLVVQSQTSSSKGRVVVSELRRWKNAVAQGTIMYCYCFYKCEIELFSALIYLVIRMMRLANDDKINLKKLIEFLIRDQTKFCSTGNCKG